MRYIVYFLFFIHSLCANASHIIGGDIYYDYLGNNNYKFVLTLYRDCASDGAEFDNPLMLSVYVANGSPYQTIQVPFTGSVFIPLDFDNPCATAPSGICVERAIYETVLNLPPIQGGYDVSYQRCCRGPEIVNIINPDDTGLTLTTHVPGIETGFTDNSSPRFTNYPPFLLCNNEQIVFDHVATDPDGDQLVYSMATPFSGGSSFDPAPIAPAPPYFPIQWSGGFAEQDPLGPGSSTQIDANGVLLVNPNLMGLFVVGVRVQEFRNGVLIGATIRDFLFKVMDCNITMQAILPLQEELSTFVSYCQGLTVQFENNSYGGSSYAWDFGVFEQSNDVSTTFQPTYTYPGPGDYLATLIVNPGMTCTDTAYMSITVGNPFSVGWTTEDSICITGNAFDFNLLSSNENASFEWSFGSDASIENWTGTNVPLVSFSNPGFHTISLSGNDGECATTFEDSIYIFDEPAVSIDLPDDLTCLGLTIDFQSTLLNVTSIQWDFGDESTTDDQSNLNNPSYSFPDPGTYTVQLTGANSPNCIDTAEAVIEVKEELLMEMDHSDSLCITDGLYDFQATVSGPEDASFVWDFGPNASLQNSSELSVSGIQFSNPGFHSITLTGIHDICVDSIESLLYVFPEPSIDFGVVDGVLCAPDAAQFINLSQVEGEVIYTWEFGDGGTSNQISPSYPYSAIGDYSVGLTLISLEGCLDTLYLLQQDLVNVYPSPTAGFTVNPNRIDVCDNEVLFINQSIGASSYAYYFDQGQYMTNESDFTHYYTQSGSDYPMQIAYNEFGCADSIRAEVFVEPFTIYIPNTFIPDEDGLNDIFTPITDFEIHEWDLSIYSQWGELIYNSQKYANGWDGTFKGKRCQDGTYIYKLKYKSCANPIESKLIKGFVNLIR